MQPKCRQLHVLKFKLNFVINALRGGHENVCEYGYTGIMCQMCVFNSSVAFAKQKMECLLCEKYVEIVIRFMIPYVLTLTLIIFGVM